MIVQRVLAVLLGASDTFARMGIDWQAQISDKESDSQQKRDCERDMVARQDCNKRNCGMRADEPAHDGK